MRLAAARSSSGWTVWSLLATMYQLGLVRHATPGALWSEQVGGREVGCPDHFLLFLGQVAGEARGAREASGASAGDLDVGEDVRDRKLVLLALRCLGLVRREGGDVDQPSHAVVGARRRDDASAVRWPMREWPGCSRGGCSMRGLIAEHAAALAARFGPADDRMRAAGQLISSTST